MSNNVRIEVLLNAVDRASRPLKAIQNASKSLAGDIRNSQTTLRDLNAQASRIDGFRKASAQLAVTGQSLNKAKQEAAALAVQFKNTVNPTNAQARAMEAAKNPPLTCNSNITGSGSRYSASAPSLHRPG